MRNCLNCGKENPPSKGKKPRKYCSTQCNAAVNRGQRRPKKPEGWIRKGDIARVEREKRRKNFEWHKENWLTTPQLAELLGVTPGAVHHRAIIASIPPKIVTGGKSPTAFWNPADVEKLQNKVTPIPEGYITRKEACRLIGIAHKTFTVSGYHNKIKPDMIWYQTHGHKSMQHLYLKEKIEAFAIARDEAMRAQEAAWEKARVIKQNVKEERIANRLKQQKLKYAQRAKEAAERKIAAAKRTEAAYQRKLQKGRDRIPKSTVDWQSYVEQERRLFNRFPKLLEKYDTNSSKYNQHSRAIKVNEDHARLFAAGIVRKFECKSCYEKRPYYNFYYDEGYVDGRRLSCCRACQKAISKKSYNASKVKRKEQRKLNYRGKFRTLIGQTIKQDISRMSGRYCNDISVPVVWEHLEKHCGYDIDGFIDHFENQFDKNMNWFNHGRGTDQYYWQMDHIIPRSKFVYTSLNDPAFAQCWSLDNLQPLSAYENNIKDNPLINVKYFKENFTERKNKKLSLKNGAK